MNVEFTTHLHIIITIPPNLPQLIKKSDKYIIWILISQYLNYANSFWLILFQILEAYKIPSLQKWPPDKAFKKFSMYNIIFPMFSQKKYITSFTNIFKPKIKLIWTFVFWEVIFTVNKPTEAEI